MNVRNFCIIAHIDHGKSTLSDRLLEQTGTISTREMKDQMLDTMDLERERGITIKLQPARMQYRARSGVDFTLNLIDTPGHVDFTYEVSRSLAACEGAILLVDASQGVQAQTITNLYLALEQDLTIIPVINKIDLPNADIPRAEEELVGLLGCAPEDIVRVSGKTGVGVDALLEAIVERVPSPKPAPDDTLRALIFDAKFDDYKGVVAYVRVVSGRVTKADKLAFASHGGEIDALEVGYFRPDMVPAQELVAGDIGYIATGLKDISASRVGDTITTLAGNKPAAAPLPGYREVRPMVFAGIFPHDGDEFEDLRDALLKLKMNDSALQFESEHSAALGYGFRIGLLGLLHLEIVRERLLREHEIDIVVTVPSVGYDITLKNGTITKIRNPEDFPDPSSIEEIREPWVAVDAVAPAQYIGALMGLFSGKRGIYKNTEYIQSRATGDHSHAIVRFDMPLSQILTDFYDKLKSISSGYASFSYEFIDYRPAHVVRLDILVADERASALSSMVYEDEAQKLGAKIVETLKDSIPRAQFAIKLQACVGAKIIASERIAPFRKDVTAKLYGGDITRRMKLLEKQKKGKKRMMNTGSVDIPAEAYMAVLRRD